MHVVSAMLDRLNRYNSELNVVAWAALLLLATLLLSR
jgi:hypothetical protein